MGASALPRRVACVRGVDCTYLLVHAAKHAQCMHGNSLLGTRAEQNPEKYSTLQGDQKGQDPHAGSEVCVCACVCVCVCVCARAGSCVCVNVRA